MDWDNMAAAALGALVGGVGGFFSRKTAKEDNEINGLVAAASTWADYAKAMQHHWETCEVKLGELEERIDNLEKDKRVLQQEIDDLKRGNR